MSGRGSLHWAGGLEGWGTASSMHLSWTGWDGAAVCPHGPCPSAAPPWCLEMGQPQSFLHGAVGRLDGNGARAWGSAAAMVLSGAGIPGRGTAWADVRGTLRRDSRGRRRSVAGPGQAVGSAWGVGAGL